MFSIIVPVYNKEDYILKSINSVLQQAYSKFELIVINDGSTDKSLLNIKKFNDPRIVIINATMTVCATGPSFTAETNRVVFWLRDQFCWRRLV